MELTDLKSTLDDIRGKATEAASVAAEVKDIRTRLKEVEDEQLAAIRDRAAQQVNGRFSGGGFVPPEQREHAEIFTKWLRNPRDMELRHQLQQMEHKVASGLTDAAGGAAVPELLLSQIITRVKDNSVMRSLAGVYPVSSGDIKQIVSNNDATSSWVGETGTRTATAEPTMTERNPTFGTNFSYISAAEELVYDSAYPIGEWFTMAVSDQIIKSEGEAFISGNGTNKPTGILNAAPESAGDGDSPARSTLALQYLATGAAGAFQNDRLGSPAGNPLDVVLSTVYTLKADYRRNAVWLMNSATAGVMRRFKDADGRYLWQDPISQGQPATLAGYAVYMDESMPDIGSNTHPVLFGDFRRGYGVYDAGTMRITLDDNITTPGRVKWYIRRRVGGITLDNNAVKAIKAAAS